MDTGNQRYLCLGAVVLLIFSHATTASAEGTWVNCSSENNINFQYFNSSTIEVGKNTEIGDVLGGWLTSTNNQSWACTPGNWDGVRIATQGYTSHTQYGTMQIDGGAYTIYDTNLKTGLGYIVRWRFSFNGQVSDWQPLTIAPGGQQIHSESFAVPNADGGQSINLGTDVQLRFVKTADDLTAGSVPTFHPIYMEHYQTYNGGSFAGLNAPMVAQFQPGSNISNLEGTCTTPDVIVNLPTALIGDFRGVGTTTARTGFDLAFNQCPTGLVSIGYSFAATTSVVDSTNGVVAMNSSSTATGVGVQLLDGNMAPIVFNTRYPLAVYDPSLPKANSNYRVPMTAGLYQTGGQVTSGTVSSAVTFTLNYK
ncbi:fimbrial protein [Edaphovirga cremea]|uniref:fimbrial protein n=1 Tax=Edaphovirga cremea TaxID=2267246 RepID=UPI000DEF13D6|nr:fimbrial protein [Edaphovirga cremea]